ncbi:MAG: ParB/RepB/Spo0J family partition protein [Clostridiales bacterium]|jgi:ParB family chromosome partitioning protein|nr:ParB/RepB/Spo0J family partition protein [Clostridiales bacterium]
MEAAITDNEILYIPVDDIKPNPYQPRRFFNRARLEELAESIRQCGVIQPISVRVIGRSYELVAGERRLRASKIAGMERIPAVVAYISDQESAVMAIIENLQRQELNFLEEAEGLHNLLRNYSFTQEALAAKIGKTQSTVANKLRVLRLPASVKNLLVENDFTERHARELLRLTNENDQLKAAEAMVKYGLTVKKTEELVGKILQGAPSKRNNFKIKRFIKDIRIFTNTIRQAVSALKNSGVSADYYISENESGCDIQIKVIY